MKNTLETRLGLFVALAVLAAVLILEIVGGIELFQRGYALRARFTNVQDLKPGDRVKMGGVDIGRVEILDLATNESKVEVTFKIKKGVPVKTDSKATVKFSGLMGQSYVSIDFGSRAAKDLEPGMMVESAEQPDLSAIMGKIDNVATGVEKLTQSFTGDKIDNLLGPLTDFLKANREPLTATFANFKAISTQVASGQGSVGRMIYDDTLYNSALNSVSNLQASLDQVQATVADARKAVDQINSGKGTVGLLLQDESLYRESTASMATLKEILQKINQGQGTVGKLVNEQDFYKNAKLTLQKLDKATEGLEDQGPLSVMGIVVNKLF
jgi:phospholipid/cholesterol/gamma-HCH transport system substrate-binding protein